jgi:anthranilate synthase component 2
LQNKLQNGKAGIKMKQRILLIDNYDSFTYNLFHALYTLNEAAPEVIRNDNLLLSALKNYDAVVLSPGPGLPHEAGKLMQAIETCWDKSKILGVCLGHQALALHSGAKLKQLPQPYHGVTREGFISGQSDIYRNIQSPFEAGSYHSWTIDSPTLPACWNVNAVDSMGEILSMQHKSKPITGIQFHPESVLTPMGYALIENWLEI